MIERVERYVFTVRPGQADLIHRWAAERGETPERLGYTLLMVGFAVVAADTLGWATPSPVLACDEQFQGAALAALRERLGLAEGS